MTIAQPTAAQHSKAKQMEEKNDVRFESFQKPTKIKGREEKIRQQAQALSSVGQHILLASHPASTLGIVVAILEDRTSLDERRGLMCLPTQRTLDRTRTVVPMPMARREPHLDRENAGP